MAAQSEVEKTVALMAAEIGADLTAALSLEVTQVRRVARSKARGVASAHVGSGATSEHRGRSRDLDRNSGAQELMNRS